MISKKELLDKMNISYGQLYRWKREGLIPDEWFIKQSVSTGQETFFDEKLIIPRIQMILDKKTDNQLKELKQLLPNDITKREFSIREIVLIEELDPIVIKLYNKKKQILNIYDIVLIYIMSKEEIELYDYIDFEFSLDMCLYLYSNKEFFIGEKVIFSRDFEKFDKVYNFKEISEKLVKEL